MATWRRLLLAATLLALVVVTVGAYVRLADAGLACPDWPGCYGQWLGVPASAEARELAGARFPDRPLDVAKAWKEMGHRYLAGSLGVLILGLCLIAWRRRPRAALVPTLLLALVVIQALLGMATVTLLLKPLVVTLHLLGGMATLGLLVWLYGRDGLAAIPAPRQTRHHAGLALVCVALQIGLGGWVSSHYAGLACADFPACHGKWLPDDHQGAIQMAHRFGAALVLIVGGALAVRLWRLPNQRLWGLALATALLVQVALGIANVLLRLPLPLAVAHNLGAALLLAILVAWLASSAGQRGQQLAVNAAEAAVAHHQHVIAGLGGRHDG